MEHSNSIKVVIAHGEPIVAAGLGALIARQAGFPVSDWHATQSAEVSAQLLQQCGVQIVVADYQTGLRLLSEREALERHDPHGPHTARLRVMLVTSVDREWEIRTAVAQGVSGYVMQDCRAAELIDSLNSVARGRRYLCSAVALRMADSMMRDDLTGRETDVLGLLSAGFCNKSIAKELGIAVGTVKVHVKGILEKLDATTRTQAVVVAGRRGLVKRANDGLPDIGNRLRRAADFQFQVAH